MNDGAAGPIDTRAEVLPSPVPGAPYTSRSMAHLQLGQALRSVSEFACAMVPIGARPSPIYDGVLLADALALREMAEHVVVAALLTEREDGTSWAEIGRACGVDEATARDRWADDERTWRADLEGATGQQPRDGATGAVSAAVPGHAGPDTDAVDPDVAASALDAWVHRHLDPSAPDPGTAPVTYGMDRMDPFRELLHLAALRRNLTDSGPAGASELAAVYDRTAVVCDALAVDPEHGSPEHNAEALAYRGRAATLRDQMRTGADTTAPD